MVVLAPATEESYDPILKRIAKSVDSQIRGSDDDFFLMIVGSTGTGKSVLMLNVLEDYDPEEASVDYLGWDQGTFATALRNASRKKNKRFVGNDEANVNKRNNATQFNKDTLDLYYANRKENMFHIWCNPSLDAIDKPFIKDRIDGVIYIYEKTMHRPRCYYYFHKKDILTIWDKAGNLDLRTLKKYARRYASWRGWFRDYKGPLRAEYIKRAKGRVADKTERYYRKYALKEDFSISYTAAAKDLGVSATTIKKHMSKLIKQGVLISEQHILETPTRTYLNGSGVEVIRNYMINIKGGALSPD